MILVIGDIMLDEYLTGDATRLSPEYPVPVVLMKQDPPDLRLGGAANVAASVAALGEEVFLLGPYAKDRSSDLKRLCEKAGINLVGRPSDYRSWAGITTVKTRVVDSAGRMLIRLDREGTKPWDGVSMLRKSLKRMCPDAVIFSDYAKGCYTDNNWGAIEENLCEIVGGRRQRIVVDAKRKLSCYTSTAMIKCNQSEWDRWGGPWCANDNVVITKGEDGLSHRNQDGKWIDVPTERHPIYDVSGAGDVVTAVLGVGLARNLRTLHIDWKHILEQAVKAASASVAEPGTCIADSADVDL